MTGPREWRHAEDVLLNQYGRTYEGIVKTLLAPVGGDVDALTLGGLSFSFRPGSAGNHPTARISVLYRLVPIEEATDD